jgi:Protein of unknown function (DUF3300)
MITRPLRLRTMASAAALLAALPAVALAQQLQVPSPSEAAAALAPAPQFSRAQLDQILAPIALYPDQVLMQVLMAATFPDQLLDAERWLEDAHNAALRGEDLWHALEPLPWDPSVKSLVAFPQLVLMLSQHLDWTEALGLAFANQQGATMARIQYLRHRAYAAGHLRSTRYLRVERDGPEIVIVPAEPNMAYLPLYNPAEIYGVWPDRSYPPIYIPPPPNFYAGALGAGIGFSVGFGIVAPLWGWGHPDWRRHEIVVDRRRYAGITRAPRDTAIRHNAWHRTAPIARVPEAARPHPHPGAGRMHYPHGTVAPTALARPNLGPAHPPAPAHRGERAVAHPRGGAAPAARPTERGVTHPTAPHPAEHAFGHPSATHPAERAAAHPRAPHRAAHPAERAVAHPHPTHPHAAHPSGPPASREAKKPDEPEKPPQQH